MYCPYVPHPRFIPHPFTLSCDVSCGVEARTSLTLRAWATRGQVARARSFSGILLGSWPSYRTRGQVVGRLLGDEWGQGWQEDILDKVRHLPLVCPKTRTLSACRRVLGVPTFSSWQLPPMLFLHILSWAHDGPLPCQGQCWCLL